MNKLGQYFTTNKILKDKVFSFILNNPSIILEPSFGQGDLVEYVSNKSDVIFDMYEIDNTIKLLEFDISNHNVKYCNFIDEIITKKYKTIIGNPPYIRTKKGNLYIDFIEKCYNLLDSGGELIFIVPYDFLKLTSAGKLLNHMMSNGTFTHIFHPNNENMFENATIDIIVFRYCKNIKLEKVNFNDELLYIINSCGCLTFEKNKLNGRESKFQDYFNIYVGLVSGRESVYKNEELGNMKIINGHNKIDNYIYINKFPCDDERINAYLLSHKEELMNRKIRKFNESNWFEFGAPRNINKIKDNIGNDCIYIYNLTRNSNIAFLGKVNYFGGNLIMLLPKKEIDLNIILEYLNSDKFKSNFMYSGRFKIGHRQLSNSYFDLK